MSEAGRPPGAAFCFFESASSVEICKFSGDKALDDKENGMNGGRVEIIPPAKERRYKRPLSTLGGLISETARIYRKMKAGKLDHDVGRSLVWVLAQQRAMLEAEALERIGAPAG